MPTFKSKRHKKQQPARFRLTPQQRQRVRDRADARRMEGSAPVYPVECPPGWHRGQIVVTLDGITTVIDVHHPPPGSRGRRARCDSMELRIDGAVVAVGGWVAVGRALGEARPRALPRRAMATLRA